MKLRKKIVIAFLSLGFVLFFSGLISFLELRRLSDKSQDLLDKSSSVMDISKRMLDAIQDQNTALLQIISSNDSINKSLYIEAQQNFEDALAQATTTIKDLSDLDSVYVAYQKYGDAIAKYQHKSEIKDDLSWFMMVYKDYYYKLTNSIKSYMSSSQNSLSRQASSLEGYAYRATTPGIITLGVAILIIVMMFFMLDFYLIKPFVNISSSLKNYLTSRIPFRVNVEGKDEVAELNESIETLIAESKNSSKRA